MRVRKGWGLIVAVALATGVGAFTAQQLWPLMHGGSQSDVAPAAARSPFFAHVNELIFGARAEPATKENNKPPQLLLLATSPGQNFHEGTARVGTSAKDSVTYAAGALLLNGALLTEIYSDHVMLERDGRTVPLYVVGAAASSSASRDEILAVARQSVPSTPQPAIEPARSTPAITDYIRPNPVYEEGRLKGFELYAGVNSAAFSQLGLAAGDVVVAVDGVPVTDPSQVIDSFQQVMAGTALTITVDRHGKMQEVSLDGAVIAARQASAVRE
jgi:membrane-associated protease RseP (regulator of RpoE activity)